MKLFRTCIGVVGICLGLTGQVWGDASAFDHTHAKWDAVLKSYVDEGRVDYVALKKHRAALDNYVKELSEVSLRQFQGWQRNEQLAFLINLYNADTLQLILDHYPVDSIKDVGSLFTKPWSIDCVDVFGKRMTLDNIEHDMIRKNYNQPLIHFAVVCAAKGCPYLRSEAYTSDALTDQLRDQTTKFLADTRKNRYQANTKTLYLSPIFKWYREDFGDSQEALIQFVSRYGTENMKALTPADRIKIRYTEYDWSLNK